MTALTPGTEPTTPDTRRPATRLGRLWAACLTFLGTTVRMWIVLIGAAIIAALIWAVSANVKEVDRRQREADNRDALAAAYAADLRAYDNALRDQADCIDSVARSDLNRGQHEAIVQAFENLKVPGTSPALNAIVDSIVASLTSGPLLSQPPRSVDECPPIPVAPVPPAGE